MAGIEGGGQEREYAIGMGLMDLCLRYGAVTLGIEFKEGVGWEAVTGARGESGRRIIFDSASSGIMAP